MKVSPLSLALSTARRTRFRIASPSMMPRSWLMMRNRNAFSGSSSFSTQSQPTLVLTQSIWFSQALLHCSCRLVLCCISANSLSLFFPFPSFIFAPHRHSQIASSQAFSHEANCIWGITWAPLWIGWPCRNNTASAAATTSPTSIIMTASSSVWSTCTPTRPTSVHRNLETAQERWP